MTRPPEELLAALDRASLARSGRHAGREVRFLCPAHDDHRPSARWCRDKGVWRCDACGAKGGALDLARRLGVPRPAVGGARRETVYVIRDAAGRPVAEHVRVDLGGGEKRVFWRRDGTPGLRGLRTAELPLFGAERGAAADPARPLFVVEGERAAACLDGIGAQAVGTVTGALGTPGAAPLELLRGRQVVLWPDADTVGARHMERVAAVLAGVAAGVRTFSPAGVPEGGDAADWIEARRAAGNASAAILRELEALARQAPLQVNGAAPGRHEDAAASPDEPAAPGPGRRAPASQEGAAAPGRGGRAPASRDGAAAAGSDRRATAEGDGAAPAAVDGGTRPAVGVEAALAGLAAAGGVEAAGDWLRRLRGALGGADALARRLARERALAALEGKVKAPAQLVDAALTFPSSLPAMGNGRAVDFAEPEPWPEPVEGCTLLGELIATFTRFVALPRFGDVAAALWTVHAHALAAAAVSPLLALTSPEKRCGKTTLLSLLARPVPRAVLSSNISPASLFRIVERYSPTLLVDEADSFLGEKEELRGLLNSGHTRDAAYVVRTVGDEHEPRRFSTWAAKAVAMIGRLPETLADRSIVVPMRRRAPDEQVERLRLDRPGAFEDLRRRAARWGADQLAELRAADPEVPGELGDRAADNWRPLLAIADLAGGEWGDRARRAALTLSGAGGDARDSLSSLLLADIRAVFREREVDRLFSQELLQDLCGREERPWGEWGRGRGSMSPRQLAARLKPFGVQPGSLRDGAKTGKGYTREQFADAFRRYLPADPSHPSQGNAGAGLENSAIRHQGGEAGAVTDRAAGANPYGAGVVTDVTDREPDAGRGGGRGGAAAQEREVFDL
jgi:hypothetical protein